MQHKKSAGFLHIIFDLDGTLCDSKEGIFDSYTYALSNFDIKINSREELGKLIGQPLHKALEENYLHDEALAWEAVKLFREYYEKEGLFKSSLFPGIHDLLKELQKKACKCYIATAKPSVYAVKLMKFHGISDCFEMIMGCKLDGSKSDKYAMTIKILESQSSANVANTAFIGDRKFDIEAGAKAGIQTIGVSYGYGTMDEINQASPTFIARSVSELSKLLLSC